METMQYAKGSARTTGDVDVFIEELDEFAIGSLSFCALTNSDYVTRMMAPVFVG